MPPRRTMQGPSYTVQDGKGVCVYLMHHSAAPRRVRWEFIHLRSTPSISMSHGQSQASEKATV